MREIKFKARNKYTNTIEEVDTIDFDEGWIGCGDDTEWIDNVELMQWTGLLDINGKEIYEGDIVNYADWDEPVLNFTDVVIWQPPEFAFEIGTFWLPYEPQYYEVIGNIYENKDLLQA